MNILTCKETKPILLKKKFSDQQIYIYFRFFTVKKLICSGIELWLEDEYFVTKQSARKETVNKIPSTVRYCFSCKNSNEKQYSN